MTSIVTVDSEVEVVEDTTQTSEVQVEGTITEVSEVKLTSDT